MKLLKDKYIRSFGIALFVIVSLYVGGMMFWDKILSFLLRFPLFEQLYLLTINEVSKRSVLGLSLITFFGSLFFIGFPGEVLFMVYVRIGYNFFVVSGIMLLFSMLAQALNYGFGYFIEKKILERFVKGDKKEYLSSLKKYDSLFIVVFNILPLPGDILTLVLGMIRYDFRKTMGFSFLGKIVKYIFLGFLVYILRAV